jgi:aminoglycoside 3-N-acetyltransferase
MIDQAAGVAGVAGVTVLGAQLLALGVRPGQDLLVHCSMRAVGPVAGGAATVAAALTNVLGPDATLVVPAQTTLNSLSSDAFLTVTAGLDEIGLARHIEAMPGFDPAATPSQGMGQLAELVRTMPGAARSAHPQSSFAAIGARAAQAMAGHALDCHLGEHSPLGWLYAQDAAVLLLGVGYDACTAFHLAEYRLPGEASYREYRCFVTADGARQELAFNDIVLDASDFAALGAHLEGEPYVRKGLVGAADSRLLPIRAAVDAAAAWPPFLRRRR